MVFVVFLFFFCFAFVFIPFFRLRSRHLCPGLRFYRTFAFPSPIPLSVFFFFFLTLYVSSTVLVSPVRVAVSLRNTRGSATRLARFCLSPFFAIISAAHEVFINRSINSLVVYRVVRCFFYCRDVELVKFRKPKGEKCRRLVERYTHDAFQSRHERRRRPAVGSGLLRSFVRVGGVRGVRSGGSAPEQHRQQHDVLPR